MFADPYFFIHYVCDFRIKTCWFISHTYMLCRRNEQFALTLNLNLTLYSGVLCRVNEEVRRVRGNDIGVAVAVVVVVDEFVWVEEIGRSDGDNNDGDASDAAVAHLRQHRTWSFLIECMPHAPVVDARAGSVYTVAPYPHRKQKLFLQSAEQRRQRDAAIIGVRPSGPGLGYCPDSRGWKRYYCIWEF